MGRGSLEAGLGEGREGWEGERLIDAVCPRSTTSSDLPSEDRECVSVNHGGWWRGDYSQNMFGGIYLPNLFELDL